MLGPGLLALQEAAWSSCKRIGAKVGRGMWRAVDRERGVVVLDAGKRMGVPGEGQGVS